MANSPTYNWDALAYAENAANQSGWAMARLDGIPFLGDEHVLDIGCGDGRMAAEIATRVPDGSVLGIDSSPQMVALAKQQFPPGEVGRLRFRQLDAARLSFDAEFDVVFSNAALHWLIDHRPFLMGLSRALKPGGRAFLEMGGRGNAAAVVAVLEDTIASDRWLAHFLGFEFPYGFHGPEEYRLWLADAGLEARRVALVHRDMYHQGMAAMAAWIRTTWLPYTQRVPTGLRDDFITDVVKQYLSDYPPDDAGRVHVDMVRLEVEAVKR